MKTVVDCRVVSGLLSVTSDALTDNYRDGLPMTKWSGSGKLFFNRVNARHLCLYFEVRREQINSSMRLDARCPDLTALRSGR